jgi:hypothetical protein
MTHASDDLNRPLPTLADVAREGDVSLAHAYSWIRRGFIPAPPIRLQHLYQGFAKMAGRGPIPGTRTERNAA